MQQKSPLIQNQTPELIKPSQELNEPFSNGATLLNKKTKRSSFNMISLTEKGNQCSICLEYDYYSPSKCIQCSQCKSYSHIQCYKDNISSNIEVHNFICSLCFSNVRNKDSHLKCIFCSGDEGIMRIISSDKFCHVYCSRFFKEINEGELNIRKWRYTSVCKICKEKRKENSIPVIKCSNTKCKNYYHIQCAIKNGLIFNLGFQNDFYGLTLKGSKIIPFYCGHHNKNLITEYNDYIKQMDCVLYTKEEEANKEEVTNSKVTELDETEEITTTNQIKEKKEATTISNANKESKNDDFLKVNIYGNLNQKENENENNIELIDDTDLFKDFEEMNKKNETSPFFNSDLNYL